MKLGYLYSRYPVLSQTFCDMEMLELERRGHEVVLGSMYPPKTELRHEYLKQLRAPVHYAPSKEQLESLMRKAKRSGRWPAGLVAEHERKYGPDYKAALRARNALFFVELFEREGLRFFHVHFANRAAHTAIFVKAISGIPFGVTAHGQDFMTDLGSQELLCDICANAEFVAAETDYSRDLLAQCCPDLGQKFLRVYNGIDIRRFSSSDPQGSTRDRVRILSVARLVPFKGFDVLIDACAELRSRGVRFSCEIIGEGPLRDELHARAARHNFHGDELRFAGEQSQAAVLKAMRECDIFVLASMHDDRGASDVFPTVIGEAMASGKPVVSTTVAGIPELVANGEIGFLVPPQDSAALASAIEKLARDTDLRLQFGRQARARIEREFTIEKTIEPLLNAFRGAMHSPVATGVQ
ncbi:MAG: glycosyltransferase family 4 protein [Chthoniobacterales bacterium]